MQFPTRQDKLINYLGFAFGIVALVAGLWWAYQIGYQSYAFRPIAATVLNIRVASFVDSQSEGSTSVYKPMISRSYEVDGKNYNGTEFSSTGEYFVDKSEAVVFANKFTVGEKMTVFYDPRDVKMSYVRNEFDLRQAAPCFVILLGGLFLIVVNHLKIRDVLASENRTGF